MPRRKNTADGDGAATTAGGAPVKQPRVRKKREPSSICSTPTGEHPPGSGLKLELNSAPGIAGCHPSAGGMDGGAMLGMHPHHHHHMGGGGAGLSNGTPCSVGPGPPPPMMMDDGGGPSGMAPSYGQHPPQGVPQGPPPEFFYQQGHPGAAPPPMGPNFGPPMFGGAPMTHHQQQQQQQQQQMMMQQQQPGTAGMGPHMVGPGQYQQEPDPQQHQQMMASMHHHSLPALVQQQQQGGVPLPPSAHHNAMAAAGAAPPGSGGPAGPAHVPSHHPQMSAAPPPTHQTLPMPPPPPGAAAVAAAAAAAAMFPPGGFPRQPPGPFLMFPPTIPQPPFLEYRLQEMNRRLFQFHAQFHQSSPESHEQWWEAFAQEFFDEGARMSVTMPEFSPEQGGHVRREFTVVRALIPRFYRSLFDHGVTQLHYVQRVPAQELVDPHRYQNPDLFGGCALNCENMLMVTTHIRPMHIEVHTDCRLYIEFAPFHPTVGYRIRHWFLDIRGSQEFYNISKGDNNHHMDGNAQQELARKGVLTAFGLPAQTMRELKMMQILQPMKPIMDRTKETNESPQQAMQSIVLERMEAEQRQRSAAASVVAAHHSIHQQTPPHQPMGCGSVPPPPHPMAAMLQAGGGAGGMPHPQAMAVMPPQAMVGGVPPGPSCVPPPPASVADEPKQQKPKRQRARKTAATTNNTNGGGAGSSGGSPPKVNKKGGGGLAAAAASAGQQTPPIGAPPGGMGPMGAGFMGVPGQQFHPAGVPPPGQYHDVLTVDEPTMMGCTYGEQDERQISRVENSAFAGGPGSHAMGMGPPMAPPGSMAGPSSAPMGMPPGSMPVTTMGGGGSCDNAHQHLLGGNGVSDFEQHMHQQQMSTGASSMWPPLGAPPATSGAEMPQQAMSGGGGG